LIGADRVARTSAPHGRPPRSASGPDRAALRARPGGRGRPFGVRNPAGFDRSGVLRRANARRFGAWLYSGGVAALFPGVTCLVL
jgi:hypothetical protein